MMKSLFLLCLVGSISVQAQTAQKPATSAAKAATPRVAAAHPAGSAVPLPPGVPKVEGPVTTAFSLRIQDVKVGTGPVAEPFKLYKVFYTGWRAADGVKFDSSDDHRLPVNGPDGKPVLGPDGKPKLGDPQPLTFPQGMGRLIPGFDLGFIGMHVGGKRRLFIPWQLAYGTRAMPDQGGHPGIPAKSDLIFDVELAEMSELPQQPGHPPVGAAPARPAAPAGQPAPAAPAGQAAPSPSSAPATPPPASEPAQPAPSAPQPK